MKKILFVIDHLGQGGAQKMLLLLGKGLLARGGYEVRVMSLQPPALYSPSFAAAAIPVRHGAIRLNGSPLQLAAMARTVILKLPAISSTFAGLVEEIRTFGPQLVTSFLFGSEIFATLAGKGKRLKIVNAIRATGVWKRPWHRWLSAVCYPMVDCFTANATPTRAFMTRHEGIPADKIRVIPNGVEIPDGHADPEGIRRCFGIARQTPWLVAAGRLDPQKGFPDLIRAIHLLAPTAPSSLRLSIFGDGPQRQELQRLITTLRLDHIVRLEGYHAPLSLIFQAADLFLLSSLYEGMPNVLLEAMAARTPVVATAIDGVRDIVTDRSNGLLVPPGAPEQLAAAMACLLQDKARGEQLAAQGFADISEKFTIEAMVEGYHQLYTELLQ